MVKQRLELRLSLILIMHSGFQDLLGRFRFWEKEYPNGTRFPLYKWWVFRLVRKMSEKGTKYQQILFEVDFHWQCTGTVCLTCDFFIGFVLQYVNGNNVCVEYCACRTSNNTSASAFGKTFIYNISKSNMWLDMTYRAIMNRCPHWKIRLEHDRGRLRGSMIRTLNNRG